MSEEPEHVPEERLDLVPPSRLPPTAIGATTTPPPPMARPAGGRNLRWPFRILAGMIAILGLGGGILLSAMIVQTPARELGEWSLDDIGFAVLSVIISFALGGFMAYLAVTGRDQSRRYGI